MTILFALQIEGGVVCRSVAGTLPVFFFFFFFWVGETFITEEKEEKKIYAVKRHNGNQATAQSKGVQSKKSP